LGARPEPLQRVSRAFAVYVVGESMEPAYLQGDMLFIHPTKPPRAGNDIVLETEESGQRLAVVKRLVKLTTENWVVKQHNPAKELKFARSKWTAHVVIGKLNAT
jgi:phage repressor protein C with HTH and peptisase S24 domain